MINDKDNIESFTTVFLSYCHVNSEYADKIESQFKGLDQTERILLIRDTKDIKNYASIDNHMHRIRSSNYAILLISDAYIKSIQCMYEVLELLKNQNHRDQMFPVIISNNNFDIYSNANDAIAKYILYWEDQYNHINSKIRNIRPEDSAELVIEVKKIVEIKNSIGPFIRIVKDLMSPPFEELIKNNFNQIIDKIRSERPPDFAISEKSTIQKDAETLKHVLGRNLAKLRNRL